MLLQIKSHLTRCLRSAEARWCVLLILVALNPLFRTGAKAQNAGFAVRALPHFWQMAGDEQPLQMLMTPQGGLAIAYGKPSLLWETRAPAIQYIIVYNPQTGEPIGGYVFHGAPEHKDCSYIEMLKRAPK